MHIVVTSDLHGDLPEIKECDLLLLAGDLAPNYNHVRQFQASWFRTTFSDWLKSVPAKNIVGIGGNHDFVLSGHRQKFGYTLPWIYLNNESVEIDGLKIWGSPLSNPFGDWCNTKPEPALADVWKTIPRDVDIIMTHGPAQGYGDTTMGYSMVVAGLWEQERVGSSSLTYQILEEDWPNLKYHICGHIHEGYGSYLMKDGVWSYNVSRMNTAFKPENAPVVIDL